MVKRRPPKKTKEEKIAENYFPVDETDVKHAIEKKEKQIDEKSLEEIEVEGKKKFWRGRSYEKNKKTIGKITKKITKKTKPV